MYIRTLCSYIILDRTVKIGDILLFYLLFYLDQIIGVTSVLVEFWVDLGAARKPYPIQTLRLTLSLLE